LTKHWYAEADLFESGRAQLTAGGKKHLETVATGLARLTANKQAELVVVAYADPKVQPDPERARTLTRQQSETVLKYLSAHGAVHKKYWLIPAKTRSVGLGLEPSAPPELGKPKGSVIGALVFMPQQ